MKPRLLLAAALLLLIALISWQQFGPHSGRTADEDIGNTDTGIAAGSASATIESAPDVAASTATTTGDDITLPPLDLPLRDSLLLLEQAARAGSATAACRLHAESNRCRFAQTIARNDANNQREVDQMADGSLSDEALARRIEEIAERRRLLDTMMAHCEGVDVSLLTLARREAMSAAAGHAPSQVRFLRGAQLSGTNVLNDPTLIDEYRRLANRYFLSALDAGELTLIETWHAAALFGEEHTLTPFLPEQWRDPGLTSALIDELSDAQRDGVFLPGEAERNRVEPTPAQRAEAAAIFRRHFSAAPPLPSRAIVHTGTPDPNAFLKAALSDDRFGCERAQ